MNEISSIKSNEAHDLREWCKPQHFKNIFKPN